MTVTDGTSELAATLVRDNVDVASVQPANVPAIPRPYRRLGHSAGIM